MSKLMTVNKPTKKTEPYISKALFFIRIQCYLSKSESYTGIPFMTVYFTLFNFSQSIVTITAIDI